MSTALSCGVLIEFGNLSLGHLPELVGGSSVGTTCSLQAPASSCLLCPFLLSLLLSRTGGSSLGSGPGGGGEGERSGACKLGSEGFECVLISTV